MKRIFGISLALLIILSGFFYFIPTPSATPYSTPDSGVTWTMKDLVANSPGTVTGGTGTYVITDHVYISQTDTIIINPGEIIKFDPDVNLTVFGTLIADGEETNRITFTSNSSVPAPGNWGCIKFEDSSNDVDCIINWSNIQYSTNGIHCEHASPTITNNTITLNEWFGIVCNASSPLIYNNTISSNFYYGISCGYPSKPIIRNNIISNHLISGIFNIESDALIDNNTITGGINGIISISGAPTIKNCTISSNNPYGIMCTNAIGINVTDNTLIDCEMMFVNSTINKLWLVDSTATTINCTYPIPNLDVDSSSVLYVQNYLHVKVIDDADAPMKGALVNVTDGGTEVFDGQTGADGFIRWIRVTDRTYLYSNSPTENKTGINVKNGSITFTCLTSPDPSDINMFTSHLEIFKGSPGVAISLVYGWNLISIPYIQSDTNIGSVLSSISGYYDAVQWFNISDTLDPWKHNHKQKPPVMNDLDDIDHRMGFWLRVTEPGGVLFEYPGTPPIQNQTITLHPGWNLVGYPSNMSYNRTDGLNNITFGADVDFIQWYDASTKTWHVMGKDDYFMKERGYWFHVTKECEWEVPL
jgi:parallel beta-helix repeat protein